MKTKYLSSPMSDREPHTRLCWCPLPSGRTLDRADLLSRLLIMLAACGLLAADACAEVTTKASASMTFSVGNAWNGGSKTKDPTLKAGNVRNWLGQITDDYRGMLWFDVGHSAGLRNARVNEVILVVNASQCPGDWRLKFWDLTGEITATPALLYADAASGVNYKYSTY